MEELDLDTYLKCAYELYKIYWKKANLWDNAEKEVLVEYFTDTDKDYREQYALDDYIEEQGYSGMLYVCFNEFVETDFYNSGYMETVMEGTGLFNYYDEMINELEKEKAKMNEREKITFNYNGTDYAITDCKNGRIFFEFDGNCYGMNYDAMASLIQAFLDVVNSVEYNVLK